jgi:hypothetical protein
LVTAHSAGAELFQQLNRFGNRHNQMISALARRSRQIYRGGDLWRRSRHGHKPSQVSAGKIQ